MSSRNTFNVSWKFGCPCPHISFNTVELVEQLNLTATSHQSGTLIFRCTMLWYLASKWKLISCKYTCFINIHWNDINVVTYLINGTSLNIKQNSPTLINSLVLLLYSVKQFFQTFVYPLVIRIISPDCTCFPNSSHLQRKDYCVNVYDESVIAPSALDMV